MMYSMQSYYDHTSKTKYMEKISHVHYLNYWSEKKFMNSNQSLNIDDEVEDISIISSGKAMIYPITEATWENEPAFSDNGNMLEQYKIHHQICHCRRFIIVSSKTCSSEKR